MVLLITYGFCAIQQGSILLFDAKSYGHEDFRLKQFDSGPITVLSSAVFLYPFFALRF